MAFPTAVNDQITDSISQDNPETVGYSPAMAMANVYMSTSQALANAAHNATQAAQQAQILSQTAISTAVAQILGTTRR